VLQRERNAFVGELSRRVIEWLERPHRPLAAICPLTLPEAAEESTWESTNWPRPQEDLAMLRTTTATAGR